MNAASVSVANCICTESNARLDSSAPSISSPTEEATKMCVIIKLL